MRKPLGTWVYTKCSLNHLSWTLTVLGSLGDMEAVQYRVSLKRSMSLSAMATYGIRPISGWSLARAASQSHTRMTSSTSWLSSTYPSMLLGETGCSCASWVFSCMLYSSPK